MIGSCQRIRTSNLMMAQILELHAGGEPGGLSLKLDHPAICPKEKMIHARLFIAMNILKFPQSVGPHATLTHNHPVLAIQRQEPVELKLSIHTMLQRPKDGKVHMRVKHSILSRRAKLPGPHVLAHKSTHHPLGNLLAPEVVVYANHSPGRPQGIAPTTDERHCGLFSLNLHSARIGPKAGGSS